VRRLHRISLAGLVLLAIASGGTARAGTRGSGPVDVLYAGSLVTVMQKDLGPGFHTATGYTVSGVSAGSKALAAEIKGKTEVGDVFVSASQGVNKSLEGSANGRWERWYETFAASPLVLGYNPRGRFARALRTKPWYEVLAERGILVGRTDPTVDPKGALTVKALDEAADRFDRRRLRTLATETSDVFPEETLVGRLQAGQLDAGFFYLSESVPAQIPHVALKGIGTLAASYTVSILNGAPHPTAAVAFVEYLLGPKARALMLKTGFDVFHPAKLSGTGVPAGVRAASNGR
jgi:molybdate/tungstate transport system substrate-binding protein